MAVYSGWDGYQTSLVRTVAKLSSEQLAYQPAPDRRSAGEIIRHLSLGRLTWFLRMPAPGSEELAKQVPEWTYDDHGNRYVVESAIPIDSAELVRWLEATWQMIEATLTQWTVADLAKTYRHTYYGKTYAISRQWTIWRIMAHDIHHGGQLTALLGALGIDMPELGDQGGHIIEIPPAEPS